MAENEYLSGLLGELFYGEVFADLDDALAAMRNEPDAVFVSTTLDYGTSDGTLADLLRNDAASLSDAQAGQVSDHFALRMSGQVYLEAGTHRFFNQTDDGFRLTVNGQTVAEYNALRAAATTVGELTVAEAGWYDIRVDYFDATSRSVLSIAHSHNGGATSALTTNVLRHGDNNQPVDPETPTEPDPPVTEPEADYAAGLKGAVHMFDGNVRSIDDAIAQSSGTPAAEFVSSQVDYSFTMGNLAAMLGADQATLTNASAGQRDDNFGLTLEGQIYLEAGLHSFGSSTDDGFRLSVDGQVLSEYRGQRSVSQTIGEIQIHEAGWYDIRMDYFEHYGASALQLRHGVDGGSLRPLQTSQLRHAVTDTGGGPSEPPPEPSVNTPPVARNDSGSILADGELTLNPLANDTDADGDRLNILRLGEAGNGTARLNGDGTVTYVPDAGFSGQDSFSYQISDGRGGESTARVTVDVTERNVAPTAGDDNGFSGTAGQMTMIRISDLLANDSDANGDSLSITGISNVVNGTASISGDFVHFTGNAAGSASFDYVLSDGQGNQDRATVSLTIEAADGGGDGGTDPGGEDGGGTDPGGDGDGDGGTDHGGGGTDHSGRDGFEMIDPPQTAAEIRAFLEMVRSMPEEHDHTHETSMQEEHAAAMQLTARGDATHIAIRHGDWNDPSIWNNGQVPSEGARVLIPEGMLVNYSSVNDASIFTVRVDGMLDFATDEDSRLLVDTLTVSPSGFLVIGTEDDPVRADVNVDIVFADNGDINTGWDSMLLSRGMISLGSSTIYGAEKSSFLKVDVDAMAGDRTLTLEEAPTGWQVGDKLVLTGTYQQGWYWNNDTRRMEQAESQDEEVTIASIRGNVITLEQPLAYDHDTPREDLKAYVASMTRNVTFSSEGGEDLPSHQRGHVMFMHNDEVDVRYAGFVDLGRTDKSFAALPLDAARSMGPLEADTNLQTRYPFHFHKTGVDDLENPAMAVGNVVDGSPGWGYVHHSSNANFTGNVAFDVYGAAFVAEDGDETGIWYQNIAIKAEGFADGDWSVKERAGDYRDDGRTGDGFFFGGRLVEAAENVAANTNNGYVWFHRYERDRVDPETMHQPEVGLGRDAMTVDRPAIQGFRDNEAFGTHTGLIVVKAGADQGHDVRSVFDGFLNWETREGVNLSYTSHYTFLNVDLVGQRPGNGPSNQVLQGVHIGANAYDMVFNGISAEGFQYGVNLLDFMNLNGLDIADMGLTVIDANFSNIRDRDVAETRPGILTVLNSDDLTPGRMEFDYDGPDSIGNGSNLFLLGTKTDSVGSVDRSFIAEPQGLWYWEVNGFLEENGYHRLPDGTPVVIVPDYIADRATGELTKISHIVRLNYSESDLNNRFPYNGVLDPNGAAPVARNDSTTTGQDMDVLLDLVANDSSPRGLDVFVDGMTNPTHGDVYLQDDGTVLYRPDMGFTGTDQFYYWAGDGQGNYTRATATVNVRADIHDPMMMSDVFEF
ncbi:MAG: Ig-like domain-containing protein [Pseudorhodobacter sp.]